MATFIASHSVLQVSCGSGDRTVWFMMAANGIGTSGQAKHLVFSPGGVTENYEGGMVDNTDVVIAAQPQKSVLAYRDIGSGWYIRNFS